MMPTPIRVTWSEFFGDWVVEFLTEDGRLVAILAEGK